MNQRDDEREGRVLDSWSVNLSVSLLVIDFLPIKIEAPFVGLCRRQLVIMVLRSSTQGPLTFDP